MSFRSAAGLEGVEDRQSFILTLTTDDGFGVTFRIPHEACRALGWALQHEVQEEPEVGVTDALAGSQKTELN